ncbi:MAG: glycosyltransferase family 9 protein [Anaplasmataceae bacterium]|nr:glycosyltransferase family 9 protein [Anaplasmataceae bacterium]
MIELFKRRFFRNPFDVILSKAVEEGKKKFLFVWNRGLGDIPLGLYALVQRIRHFIPDAEITFLTRLDLREGFALLRGVDTLVSPNIRRGQEFSVEDVLAQLGHHLNEFDQVFEKPDPTRWLQWQIGTLTPRLEWQKEWDVLCERFALKGHQPLIGVHVQTETVYGYEKNWPEASWKEFFARASRELGAKIVLFGFQSIPQFEGEGVIDLRGRTSLIEMMSIIKNCCTHLVVPDSGVLSIAYYLDIHQPLKVVSLWADPEQGVLRQQVESPNPGFRHFPLIGKGKDTGRIPVEAVLKCLEREDASCHATIF